MKRKENQPSRGGQKNGLWMEMPTHAHRQKETYLRSGSLAEGTPLSGKHISDLMRRGAVEGVKVEGQWLGTRSAVDRYLTRSNPTEQRKGPSRGGRAR